MWENRDFLSFLFKYFSPAPLSLFQPHPSREQGTIPARRGWLRIPPRAGMSPEPGEIRVHGFFIFFFSAGWPPAEPFKGFSCSAPAPAEGLLSQPPFLDRNCHFSEHSFPSPGPEPSASLTSARLCDAPAGIWLSWFFSRPFSTRQGCGAATGGFWWRRGLAAGSEQGWDPWEPAQSSHGRGELCNRVFWCDGRRKINK